MTDNNKVLDEDLRLEETFDFTAAPAPIEVQAFSKRAGEIIARAAADRLGALHARRVRRCA